MPPILAIGTHAACLLYICLSLSAFVALSRIPPNYRTGSDYAAFHFPFLTTILFGIHIFDYWYLSLTRMPPILAIGTHAAFLFFIRCTLSTLFALWRIPSSNRTGTALAAFYFGLLTTILLGVHILYYWNPSLTRL